MARYLSCPAVSQICALIVFESTWIDLVANSTPMVDLESRLNSFRVNRLKRLDLPTPESPISTTKRPDVSRCCGSVGEARGRRAVGLEPTLEKELRARKISVNALGEMRVGYVHHIHHSPCLLVKFVVVCGEEKVSWLIDVVAMAAFVFLL